MRCQFHVGIDDKHKITFRFLYGEVPLGRALRALVENLRGVAAGDTFGVVGRAIINHYQLDERIVLRANRMQAGVQGCLIVISRYDGAYKWFFHAISRASLKSL